MEIYIEILVSSLILKGDHLSPCTTISPALLFIIDVLGVSPVSFITHLTFLKNNLRLSHPII